MCLTVCTHKSDLNITRSCILNPDSGRQIHNPFSNWYGNYGQINTPRKLGRNAAGPGYNCQDHVGEICDREEWQICRATDTVACHGWQNFHICIPIDGEFDILHHPVSEFLLEPKVKHLSDDTQIPYIKVRQGLFQAGVQVASFTRSIIDTKRIRSQCMTSPFFDNFSWLLEHDLSGLRISLDELNRWTSEWEAYAEQGKMEVCPATDFDSHPYAAYFEVVPGTDDMPSPNQVLREGAGTQPDGPA
ncbi:hypothetical protein EDB80DRAFT_676046 [Ilyonectria destructans]|nr:hypothetical protein EDB80DRAFT_676046 [Ilyonectria destructans]